MSSEIKASEAKNSDKKETAKEAAQDLQLVITLEVFEVINNKAQMRVLAATFPLESRLTCFLLYCRRQYQHIQITPTI